MPLFDRGRTSGGYKLAGHEQGELSAKEVNGLNDLAITLGIGSTAAHLFVQRFKHTIPSGITTDKAFTSTVDSMQVLGGYVEIDGAEGDYDIDIGITDSVTSLVNDLIENLVNSEDGYNGRAPVAGEYLTSGKDVTITITTNAAATNTKPITIYIALICREPVTS